MIDHRTRADKMLDWMYNKPYLFTVILIGVVFDFIGFYNGIFSSVEFTIFIIFKLPFLVIYIVNKWR